MLLTEENIFRKSQTHLLMYEVLCFRGTEGSDKGHTAIYVSIGQEAHERLAWGGEMKKSQTNVSQLFSTFSMPCIKMKLFNRKITRMYLLV